MEANTGNGGAVVAPAAIADTVAGSAISPQRVRQRTTTTLSAGDALQILQGSLKIVQESGIEITHGILPDAETPMYGIVLWGVSFCDECESLHLGHDCPYCGMPIEGRDDNA